jgi:putative FmdB family regulatory protein
MPIFDYRCSFCEHILKDQLVQRWDDEIFCPNCKHLCPMNRLIGSPSVVYHGDGFYATDVKHTNDPEWPRAEIIPREEYKKKGNKAKGKIIPLSNAG